MTPARKPADLVTFTHGCGTFKTRPANAHKVRAALDALKPAKVRIEKARTSYPDFKPGMTTADYIQQFHSLNDIHKWMKVRYVHADRAAPMLDPLVPEVLEEPDADYVAPTVAAKVKRAPASKVMVETLRMIASQATGPDWSAEQALEWVRDLARSTLEATA